MKAEFVLQLIAIVVGSNAIFEFIKWAVERHDKKHESPEKKALRALCEDRLGFLLRRWLHSDERSADEWRIISNLYDGYTSLDGNGEIKILYKEASQIPTTE